MAVERLQKILAQAGIASRRKAEELIAAGLVTINGKVAALGDRADITVDAVKIEGRRVPPPVPDRYLLLNKPVGYVSTVLDPEKRPTVLDLIPMGLRKALKPVGRLDFMSEGLLLLTTDGEWAQRIAHPRYGCAKVYEAKVRAMPEEREVERLRRGMWIDGQRTLPAEVRLLRTTGRGRETGNSWWEVVLREGRSRQIREMFFRVGHGVLKLKRVAIGPLRDDALPLGAWRELTVEEVESLRKAGKVTARLQGRREGDTDEAAEREGRAPRRKPAVGGPGSAAGAAAAAASGRPPREVPRPARDKARADGERAKREGATGAGRAARRPAGDARPSRGAEAGTSKPPRGGAGGAARPTRGAAPTTARPKRGTGAGRPDRAGAGAASGKPPRDARSAGPGRRPSGGAPGGGGPGRAGGAGKRGSAGKSASAGKPGNADRSGETRSGETRSGGANRSGGAKKPGAFRPGGGGKPPAKGPRSPRGGGASRAR
jgi:23S rRNA pseudouridine2605 synthase